MPRLERIRLPALTTAQVVEVDRLMVEVYRIELIQMMESAGRSLALLAKRLLDGDIADRPIVLLAGRGNNGGGGLAAARHLLNWGAWVQVLCVCPPEGYRDVPAAQLASLQAMGAGLAWAEEGWELPPCDLVIDALIGYGLRGDPRGKARDLIELANSSVAPILSLDAPSGVDTGTGQVYTPHIRAAATLTLALPKTGLLVEPGWSACGDPRELIYRCGLWWPMC
jgi:NAD(P)H-hydrate epimerase